MAARIKIALRKVAAPFNASTMASFDLKKMLMENSLKTDPVRGLMLHCDISSLEGAFK
jgi:hypothetical protein